PRAIIRRILRASAAHASGFPPPDPKPSCHLIGDTPRPGRRADAKAVIKKRGWSDAGNLPVLVGHVLGSHQLFNAGHDFGISRSAVDHLAWVSLEIVQHDPPVWRLGPDALPPTIEQH